LRIAAEPLPNLRPEGIPEDVCTAIEASMSHNPANRPQSATEFGESLRAIQRANGVPVQDMTLPSVSPIDTAATGAPSDATPAASIAPGRISSARPTPASPETKFRPTMSGRRMVQRDRLIDAMRADHRRRLIVIHAPAGFGKSTLAAQWAKFLHEDQQVAV